MTSVAPIRWSTGSRRCSTTAAAARTAASAIVRRPPDNTLGRIAEQHAAAWLLERGLREVTRNYRCRGGEIDLVMQNQDTLIFVEVRYRRSSRFGSAAESVDHRKQQRLITAARHFLMRHPKHALGPCRFDVLAVTGERNNFHTDWITDAFSA